MIQCLIGTPGSGKSLHLSRLILESLRPKSKKLVVTNVPINLDAVAPSARSRYVYVDNDRLSDARTLIAIAEDYWKNHTASNVDDYETRIQLYIDECQMLFNSRDWQKNSKNYWPTFFSVHRHYGFQIILVTQMLTSIDKQVRGVIEYYTIHRKVSNFGIPGFLLGLLFHGGLFVSVTCWAPVDEKIYSSWFLYRKKYGELYNTHAMFGIAESGRDKEAIEGEEYLCINGGSIDAFGSTYDA